jgi:hypothetical protein
MGNPSAPSAKVLDEYKRNSLAGKGANMTGSKCKPKSGGPWPVRAAFLPIHGVDSASLIHREDAACLMVEFAKLENEFSEQTRPARKFMRKRHDALRKLGT